MFGREVKQNVLRTFIHMMFLKNQTKHIGVPSKQLQPALQSTQSPPHQQLTGLRNIAYLRLLCICFVLGQFGLKNGHASRFNVFLNNASRRWRQAIISYIVRSNRLLLIACYQKNKAGNLCNRTAKWKSLLKSSFFGTANRLKLDNYLEKYTFIHMDKCTATVRLFGFRQVSRRS